MAKIRQSALEAHAQFVRSEVNAEVLQIISLMRVSSETGSSTTAPTNDIARDTAQARFDLLNVSENFQYELPED